MISRAAMVARLTPDQKVAFSNYVGVKLNLLAVEFTGVFFRQSTESEEFLVNFWIFLSNLSNNLLPHFPAFQMKYQINESFRSSDILQGVLIQMIQFSFRNFNAKSPVRLVTPTKPSSISIDQGFGSFSRWMRRSQFRCGWGNVDLGLFLPWPGIGVCCHVPATETFSLKKWADKRKRKDVFKLSLGEIKWK